MQNGIRFERIEKKFRINSRQYRELLPVLEENMKYDEHGKSIICNIYYDTPDYALIRKSIERPKFKEKLRIRSYGLPDEDAEVFVEIKRKYNGIGYKRRICVPFGKAKKLLEGEEIFSSQRQIEKEILEFVRRYNPKPMVYLTYFRTAMFGKDNEDFRVTVDTDLKYRTQSPEYPDKSGMNPILDEDEIILEIKSTSGIPDWLLEKLNELNIYQAPFSKVGACYSLHIAPKKINEREKIALC